MNELKTKLKKGVRVFVLKNPLSPKEGKDYGTIIEQKSDDDTVLVQMDNPCPYLTDEYNNPVECPFWVLNLANA